MKFEGEEKKGAGEKSVTSMRKAGEWRTLQIGSPRRSVKREKFLFLVEPTSHRRSTSSTAVLSLMGSNSLMRI